MEVCGVKYSSELKCLLSHQKNVPSQSHCDQSHSPVYEKRLNCLVQQSMFLHEPPL